MSDIRPVRDDAQEGESAVGGWRIRWAAVSNVGLSRDTNEDAALVKDELFFLADGMGGHDCGEIASETALTALADTPVSTVEQTRTALLAQLSHALDEITNIDSENGRRAGTTITGVALVPGDTETDAAWLALNIGDSRTYRFDGTALEQISIDHSQVQELVDAGFLTSDQARVDNRRNVITRALGAGMEPHADFFTLPVRAGERLLLCSDGLSGEVLDDDIAAILRTPGAPADTASSLIDAALAGGGRDNVTVVVIDVVEPVAA